MAVPTGPYCGTNDVAALLPNLARSDDFTQDSTPTQTAVRSLIERYSAVIDMRFAAVGYIIPWQAVDGEEWPESQTGLLLFCAALGVAGAISGPTLKPAPAIGTQRMSTDNAYTTDFKAMLDEVKENGLGFRAQYRVGSKAEQFVREPMGPLTDHLLGIFDATQWQMVDEYTALVEKVRQIYNVRGTNHPYDHMAAWRTELSGL